MSTKREKNIYQKPQREKVSDNNVQNTVYYLIMDLIPKKERPDFESQFLEVERLEEVRNKAKKSDKNCVEEAYTWGHASVDLWKVELDLLQLIEKSISDAREVNHQATIEVIKKQQQIKLDYKQSKITGHTQKSMSPKEKKEAGAANRELREKYKQDRKAALSPPEVQAANEAVIGSHGKVGLMMRALDTRSKNLFPIGVEDLAGNFPVNRSPLYQVDRVDLAIRKWATDYCRGKED